MCLRSRERRQRGHRGQIRRPYLSPYLSHCLRSETTAGDSRRRPQPVRDCLRSSEDSPEGRLQIRFRPLERTVFAVFTVFGSGGKRDTISPVIGSMRCRLQGPGRLRELLNYGSPAPSRTGSPGTSRASLRWWSSRFSINPSSMAGATHFDICPLLSRVASINSL